MPEDDAAVLVDSYRFCEHTRNRSFLVTGPGDALPTRPERALPLARSLGTTVHELRYEYRRVQRRARPVGEHWFYDQAQPRCGVREADPARNHARRHPQGISAR